MSSPAASTVPVDIKKHGKKPNNRADYAKSPNSYNSRINSINRLATSIPSLNNNNSNNPLLSKSQPSDSLLNNNNNASDSNKFNSASPLSNSFNNNGKFYGATSNGSMDPAGINSSSTSVGGGGSGNSNGIPIDIQKQKKAEMLKNYLVTKDDLARSLENNNKNATNSSDQNLPVYNAAHLLPGGEVAHEVYKWHNDIESAPMKRTRSQSLYLPRSSDLNVSNIREPGGFRRHHVIMKAIQEGKSPPDMITSNFIDFLDMYGHFAGEDLLEDEDENMHIDDVEISGEYQPIEPPDSVPVHGASPSKAVFLLLKSFVGTGVMFLPKAFSNGGIIFSTIVLIAIAAISLASFLLLVETRRYVPHSFGEIGHHLYGRWMRYAVLFSITISQIGFVCAYIIFVAENLDALSKQILNFRYPIYYYIAMQVFVFIPFVMIRRISRLSFTALIADAFIMFGLFYLYYYDVRVLATEGVADIIKFNMNDFALFIGTAIFTFEGIGLIIPITESMKEPEKFPKVLTGVMLFITILFTSIGVMSYAAFGKEVKTVVILSLPQNDPIVTLVEVLYALAIMLSIPLQLFPAIRIMENGLFKKSGKDYYWVKWQKNCFRIMTVVACAFISGAGADDLDKFVSLIGSLACVPLCFLYPPLFHYKVAARTIGAKLIDAFIFSFGIFSVGGNPNCGLLSFRYIILLTGILS